MKISLRFPVFLFLAALLACDPPEPAPEPRPSVKYIASLSGDDGAVFEYDDQMRIVKITTAHGEKQYDYPDAATLRETNPDGSETYALDSEGRAVSGAFNDGGAKGSCTFTYAEGYLSGYAETWPFVSGSGTFIWQGGNMTTVEVIAGDREVYSCTYGTLTNKYNIDLNQFLMGLFSPALTIGNRSANLMSGLTLTGYWGSEKAYEETTSYTYETDVDGNVTKIHVQKGARTYTLEVTYK